MKFQLEDCRDMPFETVYGDPGQDDIFKQKCESKVRYNDIETADTGLADAQKRYKDESLGKFVCPWCGCYHLGHHKNLDKIAVVVDGVGEPDYPKYDLPIVHVAKRLFEESKNWLDPLNQEVSNQIKRYIINKKISEITQNKTLEQAEKIKEKLWIKTIGWEQGEEASFNLLTRIVKIEAVP